jgi:hypothetical protein
MNCWGIRIYFTKSGFSLNGGYIVYMELLSGHEKIITKSGISLNAGTLNRGFTVYKNSLCSTSFSDDGDRDVCEMDFNSRLTWMVT